MRIEGVIRYGGYVLGTATAAIAGSTEGIAGNFLTRRLDQVFAHFRSRIQITEPLPQAILKDPQALGNVKSFRVKGKLKHLPSNHRIWLCIEHEGVPGIWPQGFSAVQHNSINGEWEGRVNASIKAVRIHAVVAPPTSVDFFQFYQKVGNRLSKWEPLIRIPVECINRTEVQAFTP